MVGHPELLDIYADVFGAFHVNWTTVRWVDLRSPFFSALAARIYFEIVEEPIPNIGDLERQGQFWKRQYSNNPVDTVQDFISQVDALELEGMHRSFEINLLLKYTTSMQNVQHEVLISPLYLIPRVVLGL